MKIFKDVRFYFVVMTLAFLGLLVNYMNQRDQLKRANEELLKCQTDANFVPGGDIAKANAVDSLSNELFSKSSELGRYEITLEHLKEVNPKAYEQFNKYLQTETE